MPAETVPGTGLRYHLITFDARGRERAEGEGPYSQIVLRDAAASQPTDVFLFSHGWNADVPAARGQYTRWLATMDSCADDQARLEERPGGFRPLLVGLHWPSKAWSDEQFQPEAAVGFAAASSAAAVGEPSNGVESLVDRYAAALADTPATREALRIIVENALLDAAPVTLPEPVKRAYDVIDVEASTGSEGVGAAPGDDRDAFDAEATYQACLMEELTSYGEVSFGGVLSPLRVLTFWQMKRRARDLGERGAAALLGDLQTAAPTARFHLMGHSFGCIAISAAVSRALGRGVDRHPVDTLVLVQGAMSLWSFCSHIPPRPARSGYFHRILGDGLVQGPVVVTTSVHDRAVRVFYPLGAGAKRQVDFEAGDLPTYGGIGTFGVRGPGIDITDEILGPTDTRYDFRPFTVHNLDADDVINSGGGVSGAHSDICHAPVAHAVWQAATVAGGCSD
ncbi:hypothetical protein [Kitasatospora sp. NPDC085879]|uniref:hypothetical protein n=1 Tax=Kitasatospora sp. NPDC085879 TaxID=3154769 RepID=UPI0034254B62